MLAATVAAAGQLKPGRTADLRAGAGHARCELLVAHPPIATTLFRLTPRGEQLRPLLEDLIRWGLPLMTEQKPGDAVRSEWLAWALELMLTDRQPDASPVTVELQTGDQPIVIETRDRTIHSRLGPVESPDATLTGPPKPILGLLLGLLQPADAKASGIDYQGDPTILDRIGAQTSPTPPPG